MLVELSGMAAAGTVVRPLARGGFGRVELVKLKKGGVMVARKVFDPKPEVLAGTTLEKLKQRFRREVLVQSRLSSDFFIPVLESELDAAEPWFTMPVAERSYALKIEEDRAAGTVDAAALADILAALEELHSLGYAHRDLKPSNILFHAGRWKLSDFGLVLPIGDETTTTLTSVNSAWGSHLYCAPEQLVSFHNVTFAADIYSFGCILHDLVSEDDEVHIPYQQATCAGPLGAIIEKCTELTPKKRFQAVADLRGVLLKALAKKGAAPSQKAAEWVKSLENVAEWDSAKLKDLVRSVRRADNDTDRSDVLDALDEAKLEALHAKDPDVWEELARQYCHWVANAGFKFEYCDVLVRRVERIFALGSVSVRAVAALAAAKLGSSHNRWFVMRRLMAMCGPKLDEKVAERIAIEIVAEQAQYDFACSARRINQTLGDYHPAIAEVLKEYQKAYGTPI
jgi:eukaryotic-like serine/threonine-protein kinase